MKTFEELGLSKKMLEVIKELRIETPTEIQEKAIPLVMSSKDVIGESSTGSGKTLVFSCGVVQRVEPKAGLQALILTPTRELAEQVKQMVGRLSSLRVVSIYGGVSYNPQIENLRRADVVVATPGRLLDHLNQRTIDLSKITLLVLDEADRMLDMGFIRDVEKIVRVIPSKRQTLFFSATISDEIQRLARKYMIHPIMVSAERYVDQSKLKQYYYDVSRDQKMALLAHLLQGESKLVMIFCNTRHTVDFVVKNLRANKIVATAIHGGLSQNKRNSVLGMFNEGKAGALVCTDVAARGLHINNVSHIYNYDLPKDANDYVHRIGRTARAGEEGKVINVLCEIDHDSFRQITNNYPEFSVERIEVPELKSVIMIKSERRGFGGRFGNREGRGRFGNRDRGRPTGGDRFKHRWN